ncbi:MAG: Gfo/Idh/MocA family protein [Candidatus Puniceispirillaceae bacterium]
MGPPDFNVACVGAGYFAQLHHAAWQAAHGARLVAVADSNPDAPIPPDVDRHASLDSLLRSRTVDILDIATPPDTHAALIEMALAHGVRRIICQKPFCGGPVAARQVTDLAVTAGADLIVHENFRFQPWYRVVKDIIASGRLGRIFQFHFALRPGDGRGPEAYLDRQPYFQTMERFLVHETAVHFLDLFTFLLGPPDHVYADLRRLNQHIAGEDAGLIICGYADGRRAVFDGNRLADHAADNLRLTMGEAHLEAEYGCIRLDGHGRLQQRDTGTADWYDILPPASDSRFGGGCVEALCQHAVTAWRDGTRPENSAAEYLAVMALVEAVYDSAATGQQVSPDTGSADWREG